MLLIEGNVTGDIVISTDEDFDAKLCLLKPFDGFLQFRESTLVREISCVDQYVSSRELRSLIVSIRDTDDSDPPGGSHDHERWSSNRCCYGILKSSMA